MSYKINKIAEQLANEYYYEGDKGPQLGGNADQESEVAEEVNEEMEAKEMEGNTPENDNLIINKNNNPTDGFGVLAELNNLATKLDELKLIKYANVIDDMLMLLVHK